jgi:hypothetical protein
LSNPEDRSEPVVGSFVNSPQPVEGLWKPITPPEPFVPWRLNYNDKKFLRKLGIDPEN